MKLHTRNIVLCFCYHSSLNSFCLRIHSQSPHGSSMFLYQQKEIEDLFFNIFSIIVMIKKRNMHEWVRQMSCLPERQAPEDLESSS